MDKIASILQPGGMEGEHEVGVGLSLSFSVVVERL